MDIKEIVEELKKSIPQNNTPDLFNGYLEYMTNNLKEWLIDEELQPLLDDVSSLKKVQKAHLMKSEEMRKSLAKLSQVDQSQERNIQELYREVTGTLKNALKTGLSSLSERIDLQRKQTDDKIFKSEQKLSEKIIDETEKRAFVDHKHKISDIKWFDKEILALENKIDEKAPIDHKHEEYVTKDEVKEQIDKIPKFMWGGWTWQAPIQFKDESLSSLSDATITAITSGEILKWNGTAWINNTLAEAWISAVGHTHTASDITDFDTEVSNNASVVANTAKTSFPWFTSLTTDYWVTLATVATSGALADTDTTVTGAELNALKTKVDGIEAGADVTDTANVTAAWALMDSEVINLAQVKAFDSSDYAAASHTHTASDITDLSWWISFVIDGGGSAITTGNKGHVIAPYDMTITGWTIVADQSWSIVVDLWKDTYANFPPTVADTITWTEKPTLSTAQKNQDTSLTSWTTTISAWDIIAFNVDSAATVTQVSILIEWTRS